MCYHRGRESQRLYGFTWQCPIQPQTSVDPLGAHPTNTSIPDVAWGSHCPSVDVSLHLASHCFAPVGHAGWRSLVKSYSYRERDYAFGQMMLTLRTNIGLTQAGLADRLGVSRRAVAEWEGGLSYPKAERLKQLIELGVQQKAFTTGRDEEEIRALWKAAHRKVLLDEAWLQDLLASPRRIPLFPQAEPRGGSGRALPVDRAGALPPGYTAGYRWHRQEYAGLLPGAAPGAALRGGALALGSGRPLLRGAGRRLHHLLLRDAARGIPHLAGAAYHAAFGTLAGEPLL